MFVSLPDKMVFQFLREVAVEIAEPLTTIYNKSLQSGVVPSAWKKHQGSDDIDPTNFRPISVVLIVAKVLEKLLLICLLI